MKQSTKELITANFRNYGIMILFLISEFILLAIGQIGFGLDVMTSNIIVDLILCFVTTWLFFKFRKSKVEGFTFEGFLTKKEIANYVLYFLLLTYCMNVLFTWFGNMFADPGMESRSENITSSVKSAYLYLIISLFVAPIQEESMMRLWLYNLTKSRSHWMIATAITAVTFGLLHGTTAHTVFATLFAILLTCIYEYTQVWYISILGHYVYNAATLMSGIMSPVITASADSAVVVILCWTVIIASILYFAIKVQKKRSLCVSGK